MIGIKLLLPYITDFIDSTACHLELQGTWNFPTYHGRHFTTSQKVVCFHRSGWLHDLFKICYNHTEHVHTVLLLLQNADDTLNPIYARLFIKFVYLRHRIRSRWIKLVSYTMDEILWPAKISNSSRPKFILRLMKCILLISSQLRTDFCPTQRKAE